MLNKRNQILTKQNKTKAKPKTHYSIRFWIVFNFLLFKQRYNDYLVHATFCGCMFAGYLENKSPELEFLDQFICIINQYYQIVLHMD